MAYSYKIESVLKLLEALADKTKMRLTHTSMLKMHPELFHLKQQILFSEEYLYKRVYRPALKDKKAGKKTISLNETNIDYLVGFLGYENFRDFETNYGKPVHPVLETCVGSWYSYVRCNTGVPDVYRAPVHIYMEGKEVRIKLQGPVRTYTGTLLWENNCIYSLLESQHGKKLQLIFKVGLSKPDVLQGVFSGVSTAGEPIAGRELFIRQDTEFKKLTTAKIAIKTLLQDKNEEIQMLGFYFSSREQNILKGGQPSTFGMSDLRQYLQPIKLPVKKARR